MQPLTRRNYRRGTQVAKPKRPLARSRGASSALLLHVSVISAMVAGFVLVSRLPQLTVTKVVIEGCSPELEKELRDRINLPPDASILTVNLARIRKDVEVDPRVEKASVIRCLPDRVQIQVFPRQAKAAIRQGGQYVLVDAGGVCFARTQTVPKGLDELRGIDVGDGRPGTRVSNAQFGVACRCIALADSYDPNSTWIFDFSDPSNIVMIGSGLKAFLGTAENLERKMFIVFAAPEAGRRQGIKINANDIIDVRRPDAAVLVKAG